MSHAIFINYRRRDELGFTLALVKDLGERFGSEEVFFDQQTIPPGVNFAEILNANVASCEVMLVVIGPNWLTIADEKGARRLDNQNDYVRIEIESALRQEKRIIPVLVNGASMPAPKDLPKSVKPLALINAVQLSRDKFLRDCGHLADGVAKARAEEKARREEAERIAASAQQKAAGEAEIARRRSELDKAIATGKLTPLLAWAADPAHAKHPSMAKARATIAAHPEEIAWHAVDRHKPASLEGFLRRFPSGHHAGEARADVQRLQAQADFVALGDKPTRRALEQYHDRWKSVAAAGRYLGRVDSMLFWRKARPVLATVLLVAVLAIAWRATAPVPPASTTGAGGGGKQAAPAKPATPTASQPTAPATLPSYIPGVTAPAKPSTPAWPSTAAPKVVICFGKGFDACLASPGCQWNILTNTCSLK